MKLLTTGSATSASSSAMRTSRSVSPMLSSVMRPLPRRSWTVLERRWLRLSNIGPYRGHAGRGRSARIIREPARFPRRAALTLCYGPLARTRRHGASPLGRRTDPHPAGQPGGPAVADRILLGHRGGDAVGESLPHPQPRRHGAPHGARARRPDGQARRLARRQPDRADARERRRHHDRDDPRGAHRQRATRCWCRRWWCRP